MSSNKNLLTKRNGKITTIKINRPNKRNSLTPTLLNELTELISRLKGDKDLKCLVITGEGNKAFSSGFDINSIGDNDMLRDYDRKDPLNRAMQSVEEFPYPVIAMINGHAFGAGLELAASCDIRTSTRDAKFGMPPAKLGVSYTYSGIRKFINIVGFAKAKELFLIGDTFDSKTAMEIGFLNHTVEREQLEKFTYSIAEKAAKNAPLSMITMKKMINSWKDNQKINNDDDILIREMLKKLQESDDYREGRKAFSENRTPEFKGK